MATVSAFAPPGCACLNLLSTDSYLVEWFAGHPKSGVGLLQGDVVSMVRLRVLRRRRAWQRPCASEAADWITERVGILKCHAPVRTRISRCNRGLLAATAKNMFR